MSYEIFSAEHQSLRARVRQFVQNEVSPHAVQWEEKGFPRELMGKLGNAGFLGLKFPEALAGGNDKIAAAVFIEELARACLGGMAAAVFAHAEVVLPLILELGSEPQQQQYLGPGIFGDMIGAAALAEPTAVYQLSAIETVAERQGDGYVITGGKPGVINGEGVDYFMVSARTGESENAVSLFIVSAVSPGLKLSPSRLAAWRSGGCADLVLTNVAGSILGAEGQALPALNRSLEWERIVSALAAAASAKEIWREMLRHAKERKVGAAPMYKTQEISFAMAEVVATIETAAELAHEAIWKHAHGQLGLAEALAARIYAAKALSETVERAFQIFGPAGLVSGHKVERFIRDARMAMGDAGGPGLDKELLAEQMGI
jgi:acyl-CoA dehydrogenase